MAIYDSALSADYRAVGLYKEVRQMGGVTAGAMGLGIVITLKDQISKGLDNIQNKVLGLKGASQEMMESFTAGAKQMAIGLGLMGAGAMILSKAFSGPIAAAVKFESVMADVNKVANFSTSEYKAMSAGIDELSKKVPVAAEGLGEIMAAAAQAGIAKSDLLAFTEDAAKMGVAFDISAAEAGDAMAGLQSILQTTHEGVISVSDAINHLSNNMNATAPAVLDFTNRAGGVGRMAGMSGQQIAAFGAAMIALKTPPEVASRAFNALVMKLRTASDSSKDAETAFKSLGMSGASMEQLFRKDATSAMEKFLTAVKSSENPLGVLKSIIGEGFADDIAKLAGSNELLGQALGLVGDKSKYAGSMLAEYTSRSKTTENALQLFDNALASIKRKFGQSALGIFGKIINGLSKIAVIISDLPQPVFTVIAAIAGLVGTALIFAGAVMTIGGAMKMWNVSWLFLKTQARIAMASIKSGLIGLKGATSAAMLPMLKWAAIAGLAYLAWKNNFLGIRDAATAVSEGFKMAVRASENGIVEVDQKTADALKKAGIWDYAVTMGKVFFRMRKFIEGFAEGARSALKTIKGAWDDLVEVFTPVENKCRALLEAIGLLDDTAKTNSDTWKSWGKSIGKWATYIAAGVMAFKVLKGAITVCNIPIGFAIKLYGALTAAKLADKAETLYLMALYAKDALVRWATTAATWAQTAATWAWNAAATAAKVAGGLLMGGMNLLCGSLIKFGAYLISTVIPAVLSFTAALLTNPITWIVVGIVALCAALYLLWKHWDKVKAVAIACWNAISDYAFKAWNAIKGVFSGIVQWFSGIFQGVVAAVASPLQSIYSIAASVWDGIKSVFIGVADWFFGIFQGVVAAVSGPFMSIRNKAADLWAGIKGIFAGAVEWFSGIFNAVIDAIVSPFITGFDKVKQLWEDVKNVFAGAAQWFSGIFQGGVTAVASPLKSIYSYAADTWNSVKGIFTDTAGWFGSIFSNVVASVASPLQSICSVAVSVWNGIKSVFYGAAAWFFGIFRGVVEAVLGPLLSIHDYAADAWAKIKGVFVGAADWFGGIFSAVIEVIVSPFKTAFDKVRQLWENLKSIFLGSGPVNVPAPADGVAGTGVGRSGIQAPSMPKVPAGRKTPAAAILASHQQTNNQQAGRAVAAAQAQNPPTVKNNVSVEVKPQPVTVTMDKKVIGRAVAEYNANERMRAGRE